MILFSQLFITKPCYCILIDLQASILAQNFCERIKGTPLKVIRIIFPLKHQQPECDFKNVK